MEDEVFQVLITNGDTHLGGEEFDQQIREDLKFIYQTNFLKDYSKNLKAMAKLKLKSKKAKRAISNLRQSSIEIESFNDGDIPSHKSYSSK